MSIKGFIITAVLLVATTGHPRSEGKNPYWVAFPGMRSLAESGRASKARGRDISVRSLTFDFFIPGMYVSTRTLDEHEYTPISVPSAGTGKTGKPDLPVFGKHLLVPNGTKINFKINPGEPLIFEDFDIPPVQPPLPDHEGAEIPPFTIDVSTYERDEYYPGDFAIHEPVQRMRGQDFAEIRLFPFQYNPVRRKLAVYPDLEVDISFTGPISPVPKRLRSESFENTFRRMAINALKILETENYYE